MQMSDIPFGTTEWSKIPQTEHQGEAGLALWRAQHFSDIRVRLVEYTPGYPGSEHEKPFTIMEL
jgi:hypothetical protein